MNAMKLRRCREWSWGDGGKKAYLPMYSIYRYLCTAYLYQPTYVTAFHRCTWIEKLNAEYNMVAYWCRDSGRDMDIPG